MFFLFNRKRIFLDRLRNRKIIILAWLVSHRSSYKWRIMSLTIVYGVVYRGFKHCLFARKYAGVSFYSEIDTETSIVPELSLCTFTEPRCDLSCEFSARRDLDSFRSDSRQCDGLRKCVTCER